jgi:hypothetical protein
MQRLLCILVAIAWGLWLGGLIAVFLAVVSLFRFTFPDNTHMAGTAAAGIFHLFERYQLGLAAASLLLTFCWRMMAGSKGLKTTLFALFAAATVLSVAETAYLAPKIDDLRQQGLTESDQFKALHGKSMMVYTGESVILLIGAFVLIPAVHSEGVARGKSGVVR